MWLIEDSVLRRMHEATKTITPTAEQITAFNAIYDNRSSPGSRIVTIVGNKAEVHVQGVLTEQRDFFAYYYGGGNTTYGEISQALAELAANDDVDDVQMMIDSPGGTIAGLFDCIADIEAFSKPLKAVGKNLVASAAFCISCACDTAESYNVATMWGSVGIVTTYYVWEEVVHITSSKAPKKRPDVTTEEGKAMVREELDALHQLFVESIAAGRDTTVDNVNESFGQGGLFLADKALQRGMIDVIQKKKLKVVGGKAANASHVNNQEATAMDLKTLKADHPETYQAVLAVGKAEGITEGKEKERDRVVAHVTMGKASGDLDTALKAIQEGTEMTATMQSTYMAAGMNRQDRQNRQDDDDNAGDAANGARAGEEESAKGEEAVVSAIENLMGVAEA